MTIGVRRPFFSPPLPLVQRFYRLFDPAGHAHAYAPLPLAFALRGGWRIYRDMREVYAPRDLCLGVLRLRLEALSRVWITTALVVALTAWLMPVALPVLLVFAVWARHGLWYLWWSSYRALTILVFAVLERLEILAPPQPDWYPALTVPCAAYVVVWAKGRSRRRIVGAAFVALMLPAAWVFAGGVALAALVGLVPMSIGAAASVVAVGGVLDRQLTAQRCLRRALILFWGEALSWWWPAPDVNRGGEPPSMTSEGAADGE